MRNKNDQSMTKIMSYSCAAYVALPVLLYTIFFFQYRDTIQLSSLAATIIIHAVLAVLLTAGIIRGLKKQILSHYISPEDLETDIDQIFKSFNRKDSAPLRGERTIQNYMNDKTICACVKCKQKLRVPSNTGALPEPVLSFLELQRGSFRLDISYFG